MGLNAVVYRNANVLTMKYGSDAFVCDASTGELTPKQNSAIAEPRTSFVAIEIRIGNFDAIGRLRTGIWEILRDEQSILLRKVLHSATHCGDIIEPAAYEKMKAELASLRRLSNDAHVQTFVNQMEQMINAALDENNPIVFI